MKELKSIKVFLFDKARYRVSDSMGNNGVLEIDYKVGTYRIVGNNLLDSASKELNVFAKDLVRRKSGRNFAE